MPAATKSEQLARARVVLYSAAARSRLDPTLLVASRARGYLQVFANVILLLGLMALAAKANSIWQCLALYVAIGFALHRLFFPVHDCLHYSLFPTKTENRIFGALISALLGTSFEAIRDQHMVHHREFGNPDDPGASDYFPQFRSRRELLGFLLGPLVGSILFKKLGEYVLRPARAAEPVTAGPSVGKAGKAGLATKVIGYGTIAVVQGGVFALLTSGFQVAQLWRYPFFNVLPAVTIFLFLVRIRMFLEHGALDYDICDYSIGKRPTARTIYASWVERLVLCGSDFNYHHEHHLYPVVPGWQLPKLHQTLMTSGLDPQDVRRTYVQAFGELWVRLGRTRDAVRPTSTTT